MRVLARGLKSSLGSGWVLVIGGVTFTPSAWVWSVLLPGFGWGGASLPVIVEKRSRVEPAGCAESSGFPDAGRLATAAQGVVTDLLGKGPLSPPLTCSAGPGRGLGPVSSFLGLGPRPAPQHLHRQPGPVRDGLGCRPHGQWHEMPSHQQGTHGRVPGSTQGQSLCCFKAEEMQGLRRSTSLPCA